MSLHRSRTRGGWSCPAISARLARPVMLAGLIACPSAATAASITWTGAAGNGLISTAGNWSGSVAPVTNDTLNFAGTSGLNPQLGSDLIVTRLAFSSGAGAFTLGGVGRYTINSSGILNSSVQTQTINNLLFLEASQTWSAGSGGLSLGGAIDTNAMTLTIDGPFNTAIAGNLSGTGKITKIGTGTLILSGSNTHTGATILSVGTIAIGGNSALGTGAITLGGGSLQADGGSRTISNATKMTQNSSISGAADLTFNGLFNQSASRTLTVSNTGLTTFAGRLAISSGSKSRTLTLAGTGDIMVSSAIVNGGTAQTGTIIKSGTGTLTFSGGAANTYTGTTIVNAGTLLLAKSGVNAIVGSLVVGDAAGTDTVRLLASDQIGGLSVVTINSAGVLDLNNFSDTVGSLSGSGKLVFGTGVLTAGDLDTNTTFSGKITGAGGLTKSGTGTLTLSGTTNSFGQLTVSEGQVKLGATGAISSATALAVSGIGTVLDGGGFNNSAASLSLTGGQITIAGILTLSGNVSATSVGAVSATLIGKLALGTSSIFTVTSSGGGALTDLVASAVISGSGTGITKDGDGILLLSGANTYSGDTVVNAGTLRLSGGAAISDTSRVSLADASGAILDLAGTNETIGSLAGGGALGGNITLASGILTTGGTNATTTFGGAISGSGGVTKLGSGVLTLTGTSSYSGATTLSTGILRAGGGTAAFSASSAFTLANAAGVALDINGTVSAIGSLAGGGITGGNVTLGAGTLTVGANNLTTSYAGTLSGGGGNFVKTGTGTLTLTNNQTLTGAVTIGGGSVLLDGAGGRISAASSITLNTGGTLTLDNSSANNADRVTGSASIMLNGGKLAFIAASGGTTEALGAFSVGSGSSAISLTQTSGAAILNFSSLGTLTSGGTVNFTATGGIFGNSVLSPQVYISGLSQGFIGGWATVGTDFAEYATYGIHAVTGYFTGASGINVNDPNEIPILASGSAFSAYTLTNDGTTTDKALNLTDISLVSLNDSATRTLNLASGGIVKSTATPTIISGTGRLTAGGTAAGNLAITVSGGSSLTISSSIIDNAGADGFYGNTGDGSVSHSKGGPGILVLSGNNTYTGGNFINEGTLSISSESNLGASANGITFNGGTLQVTTGFTTSAGKILAVTSGFSGTLEIASGQTLTLANSTNRLVSGNSASVLYKTGAGTLVIQNANSGFTGTTRVNAGSLELRHAQSLGGAIVLAGGNLTLRNAASTSFGNALNLAADANIDLPNAGVSHTLGALAIGANTLNVTGGSGSTLALGTSTLTGNATFNPSTAGLSLGSISGAFGIVKSGSGTLTVTAPSTYTGTTAINAGSLKIAATNATSAASALTLGNGTTLDLANFSTAAGSIAGSGSVTLGSGTLTTGGNDASTIYSGVISGTGGFAKSGTGTLTLSGANTYSGTTAITRGVLQLGAAGVISDNSPVTISSGATFALANFSETIGSLAGAGAVNLGSGTLTTGANNGSTTFSGIVSGTGSLVKSGNGTLTLTGPNTFAGATSIQSGVLNARNATAFGTTASGVTVTSGAAVELQGNVAIAAEELTLNGSGIGGAGALRSVSGDNSWAGALTLASATTISADSGSLTLGGAIATGSNLLTVTGGGLSMLDGKISGAGGLVKSGTGNTVLTGTNDYTGSTQIAAGTLVLQNASALGATGPTNATTVAAGATLQLDDDVKIVFAAESLTLNGSGTANSGALSSVSGDNDWTGTIALSSDSAVSVVDDSLTLSGIVSGSGALTKTGLGELILTKSNTFTGATTVSLGSFTLTGSLASTAVTISSAASLSATGSLSNNTALTADGAVQLTGGSRTIASLTGAGSGSLVLDATSLAVGSGNFAGIFSGAGSLSKTTAGVLAVSGANTYTGSTLVSAGILQIDGNHSAATGTVTVASGATLAGSGTIGGATTIQSGGTHAATVSQAFASSLAYQSGSIFSWDLATPATSETVLNQGSYDKIAAASLSGSGAFFKIILNGSNNFGQAFWDAPHTWTDVFTTSSGDTLAQIFTGGFGGSVPANGIVPGQGSFTTSGNSLSWSAVPEPSGALGGLLLAAGLLRRRRETRKP